jgi:hypothetical protein
MSAEILCRLAGVDATVLSIADIAQKLRIELEDDENKWDMTILISSERPCITRASKNGMETSAAQFT